MTDTQPASTNPVLPPFLRVFNWTEAILLLIARRAAVMEWQTLCLTLLVIGACSIFRLLLADTAAPLEKKVNWYSLALGSGQHS